MKSYRLPALAAAAFAIACGAASNPDVAAKVGDKQLSTTRLADILGNSQAPLGLLDASVRFQSDRGWYVAAGLQNATDEQWASTGTDGAGVSLWVQPPRLWSLSFGYRP